MPYSTASNLVPLNTNLIYRNLLAYRRLHLHFHHAVHFPQLDPIASRGKAKMPQFAIKALSLSFSLSFADSHFVPLRLFHSLSLALSLPCGFSCSFSAI